MRVVIGREEALDMLRKWFEDRALLKCDFRFPLFAFCFRGRIFGLTDSEVKVASDDAFSELALRIPEDAEYGYGEPRDFPEEAASSKCGVVICLRSSADDEPDFITLEELIL